MAKQVNKKQANAAEVKPSADLINEASNESPIEQPGSVGEDHSGSEEQESSSEEHSEASSEEGQADESKAEEGEGLIAVTNIVCDDKVYAVGELMPKDHPEFEFCKSKGLIK